MASNLRVIEVSPAGGEHVTIEGDYYTEYRRYGPDSWEVLMGMSWEDVSHRCKEIEAAYQAYKVKANG